jgi:hypothetical protein
LAQCTRTETIVETITETVTDTIIQTEIDTLHLDPLMVAEGREIFRSFDYKENNRLHARVKYHEK